MTLPKAPNCGFQDQRAPRELAWSPSGFSRLAAGYERYRIRGAITKVTAQSRLMSGRRHIAQRKRRPFSGGVFFHLHDWNQLLALVSILIP
jgi:hypothetical protein